MYNCSLLFKTNNGSVSIEEEAVSKQYKQNKYQQKERPCYQAVYSYQILLWFLHLLRLFLTVANGSAKIAFGTHGCSVAGCHVLRISCSSFCHNLPRHQTSIAFKWVQHDWWILLGWRNPLSKMLHIWNNINETQGNSSNQKGNLVWGIQAQAYMTVSIVEVVPEISQCIFKFRFCCYIYIYVYISLISLQEWSTGHEKYCQNLYL